MYIKRKIIELCDAMIIFWKQLKEKMELIPDEDSTEQICKWNDYFQEHSDAQVNGRPHE